MGGSRIMESSLEAGREAFARYVWQEAYELLSEADTAGALEPQDVERLAEAAWWCARLDDCIEARERAYQAFLTSGNRPAAARVALLLYYNHGEKGQYAIAGGWLRQAERLLAGEPECAEHAFLGFVRAGSALGKNDLESAYSISGEAAELARSFGERGIEACATWTQGTALLRQARVEEGLALIDEASAGVLGGELDPWSSGFVYCMTIWTCQDLCDVGRAGEWTDAFRRWCERHGVSAWPGMCRVYRSDVLRLRGEWGEAEREARLACDELSRCYLYGAGEAFYEVGEIRLRMGDRAGTEEAFGRASELGFEPQPGLARLRLAEGDADAAESSLATALAAVEAPLKRVRLLPAYVEASLAAGTADRAAEAAAELESIAATYGTKGLHATARHARGAVQLTERGARQAARTLNEAWKLWQELGMPYEAARARELLGLACRERGDREGAKLHLSAAASAFEQLGAVPDSRRAVDLLAEVGGGDAPGATPGRRATRSFLFTDIVDSTRLLEAIGDEAWHDLVRWHDARLRSLFAQHGGEEVDHAGDGFFVAFPDARSALACAVAIQRALRDHRQTHGFAPLVRIGLHSAAVSRSGRGYRGRGVVEAARIAALAEGSEILASTVTLDEDDGFPHAERRTVTVKGISTPLEVATVEWR